jgi:hypothetical protein
MENYKELIKEVYESDNTLRSVSLPGGTTMGMVADYIAEHYKDENGRAECYCDSECWEDENVYYWGNGFMARIDIWSGKITIWKE